MISGDRLSLISVEYPEMKTRILTRHLQQSKAYVIQIRGWSSDQLVIW